jgi:hypothetical protein
VSRELLAAALLAQQQHDPPAAAHFVLLAGLAVTALAILGVRWWRKRGDASAAGGSTSHDHSAEDRESREE